jgi:hypothetical protein
MAQRELSGREYRGATGESVSFYVAEVDNAQQPGDRLSGRFGSRAKALPALKWLRHRHPRARLIRELVFRSIED